MWVGTLRWKRIIFLLTFHWLEHSHMAVLKRRGSGMGGVAKNETVFDQVLIFSSRPSSQAI